MDRPNLRLVRPPALPRLPAFPTPGRRLAARRVVDAPAIAVWDLLVDTEAWPRWGPSISAVDVDDRRIGPGTRGRIRGPVGPWLGFEVTELTPGASWSWAVAGVPATSHRVRSLTPDPAADGPAGERCEVVIEVPWWAPAYVAVCEVGVRRIARLAEDRR